MKHFHLAVILMIYAIGTSAQNLNQNKLEEIINDYTKQLEAVSVIKECGHVLDGPAYFIKQGENRTLDFFLKLSTKERKEIGASIFNDIKKSKKIIYNHNLKNDVQIVLNKITQGLSGGNSSFKLFIIDAQEINAFTTMGGYIYVTTGLLDFVESYDELAFILGHEVAHEVKLHTQRKVMRIMFFNNALKIPNAKDFKNIATNLATTFIAPFDQIDEYEADKLGFELAKNAGYDTNRFADFFKKLEKYEKQSLHKKLSSTHPFAEHRKKCLDNYNKR